MKIKNNPAEFIIAQSSITVSQIRCLPLSLCIYLIIHIYKNRCLYIYKYVCVYVYIYVYENALYSKTPFFKDGKIPRGSYWRGNNCGGGQKRIIMDSMVGRGG